MVIGVTGNIGSGKTTVANIFKELGAKVIEADKIGHLLLEKKEVKKKLVSFFGKSILNEKNEVRREILRRIVFEKEEKLRKLNFILHPLIAEEIKKKIENIGERIIIVEAAVLLDAGWDSLVDKIIIVRAPYEVKLQRAQKSRNLNFTEIEKIIKSQLSEKKMIQKADFVIENKGGREELRHKIKDLWNVYGTT